MFTVSSKIILNSLTIFPMSNLRKSTFFQETVCFQFITLLLETYSNNFYDVFQSTVTDAKSAKRSFNNQFNSWCKICRPG